MYDFGGLSDYDFELLVADLLRAHWDADVESFPRGRDSGVDLRVIGPHPHLQLPEGEELVVQCKHYPGGTMASIRSTLKAEATSNAPSSAYRYVIATSARLTRANKIEIRKIFHNKILVTDIFGRENINALLRLHQDVERSHVKLWLTSVTVLDAITHNAEYLRTRALLADLKRLRETFVETPALERAIDTLSAHGICLLTGAPGVGKTTTARLLIIQLIGQGWRPAVAVANVKELESQLMPGTRQVLFFDDFLGQNSLEMKLNRGEESELLRLMRVVESDQTKLLILTTRSYVLEQARQSYANLGDGLVSDVEVTVALSQLSSEMRAQIVYNLIYFSPFRKTVSNDKSAPRRLAQLATHRNYNPRLVDATIASAIREQRELHPPRQLGLASLSKYRPADQDMSMDADQDMNMDIVFLLERSFEQPESLWKHVLEHQLNAVQRSVLLVRASFGAGSIELSWLYKATENYLREERFSNPTNPPMLDQALAVLNGDLLEIDAVDSQWGIRHQTRILNPGLTDAITSLMASDGRTLLALAESVMYFQQIDWLVRLYNAPESGLPGRGRETVALGKTLYRKSLENILDPAAEPNSRRVAKLSTVQSYSSLGPRLRTIAKICEITRRAPTHSEGKFLEDARHQLHEIPRNRLLDIRRALESDIFDQWKQYKTAIDAVLLDSLRTGPGNIEADDFLFLADVLDVVNVDQDWRVREITRAQDWVEERVAELEEELSRLEDRRGGDIDDLRDEVQMIEAVAERFDLYVFELHELLDDLEGLAPDRASTRHDLGSESKRPARSKEFGNESLDQIFRRL